MKTLIHRIRSNFYYNNFSAFLKYFYARKKFKKIVGKLIKFINFLDYIGLPTPLVVNCTGGHKWKVSFGHYCNTLEAMANENMLPKTFMQPLVKIVNNRYLFRLYCLYEHYIPALILDTFLSLRGSKLRLVPLYKFFENIMKELSYFVTKTFNFEVNNFNALTDILEPEEREVFYMDLENVNLKTMVQRLPQSNKFYDWKSDKKSQEARKRVVYMRTVTVTFIKRLTLLFICWVIYVIVSKLLLLL